MNPAIQSEWAYHMARGGLLFPCPGGYRIENRIVRETGDYNAFFANTWADLAELEPVAEHQLRELDITDAYSIHVVDGVVPESIPHRCQVHWVSQGATPSGSELERYRPEPEEYWPWYEARVRTYPDFDETWWAGEQISHRNFTQHFQPVWYRLGRTVVGRLYRLDTSAFVRLFAIVVEAGYRGRGYGREILTREVAVSRAPVHLRAQERLAGFYQGAGFARFHVVAEIHRPGVSLP